MSTARRPTEAASPYEADYDAWIAEQAALLRAGRTAELDLGNLAEEVEDLAAPGAMPSSATSRP